VDDDPVFTKTLAHVMSEIKGNQYAEIKIYNTGEECLSNIHLNPSIVVLDYYLDSNHYDAMNGMKILKKIKQANPKTKVIILSGQTNVDVALDTIKYKAYDYVSKNENAFLRIKNIVENIIGDIQTSKKVINENKKYTTINIGIIAFLILLFLFSLFINRI
jgi:DNA-binding NtrC family response regulator